MGNDLLIVDGWENVFVFSPDELSSSFTKEVNYMRFSYVDVLDKKTELTKKNAGAVIEEIEEEAINRLAEDVNMYEYLDPDEMELLEKAKKLMGLV